MAARAKELKEEGNRMFQRKEYSNAMDQYELALKLTPSDHPDRAIFHSNRAACLMQMEPLQYDAAIQECNLALRARPGFLRALLRRARAFEATGNYELALKDLDILLQSDVSHPDAIEMSRRIQERIKGDDDQDQDDEDPQFNQAVPHTPELPDDVKKCTEMYFNGGKESPSISISGGNSGSAVQYHKENGYAPAVAVEPFLQKLKPQSDPFSHPRELQPIQDAPSCESSLPIHQCEAFANTSFSHHVNDSKPTSDPHAAESLKTVIHQDKFHIFQSGNDKIPNVIDEVSNMRPVKLVFDHDIRLGEIPVDCKFNDLRKLVKEKFPSSKSILIKYKDAEGDLVTITSTRDLRHAEAAAAVDLTSRRLSIANVNALSQGHHNESAIGLPVVTSMLDQLRLHVMEVPEEQEPHDKDDISPEKVQSTASKEHAEKSGFQGDSGLFDSDPKAKGKCEVDRWLLDFAQLFKSHLGIDPNGHIDLHEKGMELCAEALEGIATTEEAQKLLADAASRFQDMTALGLLNWGNVFMCAARKQLPEDSSEDGQWDFCDRLQVAFDWAQSQYALAEEKFKESLRVKPDFCDAMLSLGQMDFENAKLHWSLAIAKQIDLTNWDSAKMLSLFHRAEETLQRAAEALKNQECLSKGPVEFDVQVSNVSKSVSRTDANHRQSTVEQDLALKSQVYLFWGNILYEHSQVVFRLGLPSWKGLLNEALEKFEAAGASSVDISTAAENHLSNSTVFLDAMGGNVQEVGSEHGNNNVVDKKITTLKNTDQDCSQDNATGDQEIGSDFYVAD
ncbi:hypothetical protein KP509_37G038400 [Ceratopteris richardii]|nr:hypothetical protein KP509_37G038400 [Ceratopteris richardii]